MTNSFLETIAIVSHFFNKKWLSGFIRFFSTHTYRPSAIDIDGSHLLGFFCTRI